MKEQGYQYTTDLLVIGCGFSGMWAAMRARDFLGDVLVVDKGPRDWGGLGGLSGGDMIVKQPDMKLDDLLDDLVYYYDGLADQKLLGQILTQSYDRFMDFENLGHKFVRNDKGELCFIPQRALDYMRYYYYHPYGMGGIEKARLLKQECEKRGVGRLGRTVITDIITDGESEYVAVVRGDLSGDGKINTGDYVALRRSILNQVKLSKAQELDGDIDKNGKVQAKDYIVLRKFLLKLVDDLDGTVRQAVTMPEITDFRSSSFKKTATGITIEAKKTQTDGHSVKVTMVKTAWGTWNLGRYDAIENATGKTVTLNPGGTDWEYVYRVGETAGDITFCGGNHGNEKLVDIKFYDAKSGRELNDNDTADGVRIVERTQIYYNNKPDKPFVNVVRTYVINGADVWLECDYDFIRDALFNLSYTAMACIPKANGNHIVYYNTDGTTKEFSTALHGTKSGTDYGGDFDKGNPAPYVEMYGDSNPEYRMTVRVYDPYVMCDDFIYADKTMFWDMNSTQNKLYFCKFDNSKPHKVTKGTHWDTLTKWAFYK